MHLALALHLRDALHKAWAKFSKYWDVHSEKDVQRLVRLFDPQVGPSDGEAE